MLAPRRVLIKPRSLGKTLQTIALVWTLLKQNPYGGQGPVIGKAMVVCPVSLVEVGSCVASGALSDTEY